MKYLKYILTGMLIIGLPLVALSRPPTAPQSGLSSCADCSASFEPAGAITTHTADTTAVHGITDTSVLTDKGANEVITGYWSQLVLRGTLATGALGSAAILDMYWADCSAYDPASTTCPNGDDTDDYLNLKTKTGNVATFTRDGSLLHGAFQLPYSDSGDATLAEGYIQQKSDEDLIAFHGGSAGEVQDEAAISLLNHVAVTFDPDAVCDLTTDRLFLMTVGDDAPHGITIVEWKLSFDVDPTTEWAATETLFKRATAMIGVGSTAEIDDLATSSGVASEDTAANINGDAVVANGQVLYIDFPTAYTEALHSVLFEFWYYVEED